MTNKFYIDEPFDISGMSRILSQYPEAYRPKIKPSLFRQKSSTECPSIPFKYDLHKYLAQKYPITVCQITQPSGDILTMTEWSLGGGIKLCAGSMDPETLRRTPSNQQFFYLSFLFREKEYYNGACVWTRLKNFLKYLASYDGEVDQHVQYVYLRISNVNHDKGCDHLKVCNYRPSNISTEDLKKKYHRHLRTYQSRNNDVEGDPYFVCGYYNDLVKNRKSWPTSKMSDGFKLKSPR
jgi:hypothetical protein